jgi:hypothetical protein
MKIFLLFLISISILATNIKFEYNERVNLVRFLFTVSDYGEGSILLQSIHKRKRGDKDNKKIKEFKDLVSSMPFNIDLYPNAKDLPKNYRRWKKKSEMLTYLASSTSNMNDFKSSLYSIYPNKKAYQFSEIINYFLPVYREVFYQKNSKKDIKKVIQHLAKIDNKTKKFFDMEKNFYNSKINIPEIKIFLFPLFIEKKEEEYFKKNKLYVTRANSLKTIQVVEIDLPYKNNISFYGVVLHEIAHFCYDSSELISKFSSDMEKKGKFGKFAAQYLNEALATAIGNGYIPKKMNQIDKSAWYNDPIIDKYAHKIYPTIEKILENKDSLKLEQTDAFVQIFKEAFPDIFTKKEIVFNNINMISSSSFNYMDLIHEIRKHVIITNSSASSPINHKITKKSYNEKDGKSQIFVLKFDELNDLKEYKKINFKELQKDSESKKAFVRITLNKEEDRYEIFFLVNKIEEYKELVKRIMKLDNITERIVYLYK